MRASDPVNRIMSEPLITVAPDESISTMVRLFLSHPVHHLPVVDGRKIVGMLSSADLMKLEFFLPPAGPASDALLNERWRIRTIMRSPVIRVAEHETVQRAAEVMAANGIHALPVVNSSDELIGIVTTTDMMRCWLNPSSDVAAHDAEIARHLPLDDAHVHTVLTSALRQVNANRDPYGIAAMLLAMQGRVRSLEQIATAAKRYLNAGQDERLHACLRKAIERADVFDEQTGHTAVLGLGISG
jgi:CBS domain-containing protein